MLRLGFAICALLLAATTAPSESAIQFAQTYTPSQENVVVDYSLLDLDKRQIGWKLDDRKHLPAYQVYRDGGYSGSFAILTLQGLGGSAGSYKAGTKVTGATYSAYPVIGYLTKDVSWTAAENHAEVEIQYELGDLENDILDCQVGGLWRFSEANRRGCECDIVFGRVFAPVG